MKKLVVLTGAGISAESGIPTFRGLGGMWQKYDITELASPEAWRKDKELVLNFYNERRKGVVNASPNEGHLGLVKLEKYFDVQIITQNVDDLHERAGSSNVLHLHGQIRKSRSTADESLTYDIDGWELKEGDMCEKGSQLRPHIVWFGEPVPAIKEAYKIAGQADVFVIIGTSLVVYPAAGLVDYVPGKSPRYLIDPSDVPGNSRFSHIKSGAVAGVPILIEKLISKHL